MTLARTVGLSLAASVLVVVVEVTYPRAGKRQVSRVARVDPSGLASRELVVRVAG